MRGLRSPAAWSLARVVVVGVLTACTERASATTDSTRVAASDTVIDSLVDQPSTRSAVLSPRSDTALSAGIGSLRGSIDSALSATAKRIRPAAR